jgi:hypothetical protein
LELPKIIADYKQTGAKEDDEYYLMQNGSSNKLIRMNAAYDAVRGGYYYMYATKNYQFWKIRYYYDTYEAKGEGPGGANKWVITTEDGTEYIYGDQYSGRNTVQWMVRWSNWMGNSAQTNGQGRLATVWNLSQIVNVWNEKVTYEYEQVEQYVGSSAGLKHTEASYVKQITDVYGRKVQFFYKEKNAQYYTEPHVERTEPDAYQEQYEKNFLDHIDVVQEDGSKLLSVHLSYGTLTGNSGCNKMLLTGITQRSGNGKTQPGMSFTYYTGNTPYRGCIEKVTYPASGTVTYTYADKTIPRSNRELVINAPNGYAEPKIYQGEDYVAVLWRQLGSNGSHVTSSQDLMLYVYTWVGEWKEQYIGHAGNVELTEAGNYQDYKDFEAIVQKDFFAILTRSGSSATNCYIVHRNAADPGNWTAKPVWNTQVGFGGLATLISGTNYIALAPKIADGTHPGLLFSYTGDGFTQSSLNLPNGGWDYCGTNNYFMCQSRWVQWYNYTPKLLFYYLTEDRKWVQKDLGDLRLSIVSKSNWYASNSMAIVMAPGGPEYPYLWNYKYDEFFRDETNVDDGPTFGEVADEARVFIMNNSMVGMAGHVARYDGWFWHSTIVPHPGNLAEIFYSYGDDYVVRPRYPSGNYYTGAILTFDPNQLAWQPDIMLDDGHNLANAGNDYFYYGNGYWYKNTDGTWVKKRTDNLGQYLTYKPVGGYPRFDVWYHGSGYINTVTVFKNGEILSNTQHLFDQRLFDKGMKFVSHGVGSETIVTYPAPSLNYYAPEDAKILRLTRLVNDEIEGLQIDNPVSFVTVNDGTQNRYVSYKYETSTAYFDPSGNSARYNEVSVVPGSSNPDNHPYGYTKYFFNNGYSGPENGYPVLSSYWQGMLYETRIYDNNDQLISSEKTNYDVYSKDILNVDGNIVYTSHYVRPASTVATRDGIVTSTTSTYDAYTGLIRESTMNDYNSKQNQFKTTYKYFWEQYDPNRIMNILSPVIQTRKSVTTASGQVVTDVMAVTWKSWNNVYAPHKTYQWKRTGSADFDFNNWSGTGEPTADWLKLINIDVVDAAGNPIQVTNR